MSGGIPNAICYSLRLAPGWFKIFLVHMCMRQLFGWSGDDNSAVNIKNRVMQLLCSDIILLLITGEFGIVYKAHLTRPALRKAECETVAVKTIKGKDIYNNTCLCNLLCHAATSPNHINLMTL